VQSVSAAPGGQPDPPRVPLSVLHSCHCPACLSGLPGPPALLVVLLMALVRPGRASRQLVPANLAPAWRFGNSSLAKPR